MQMTDTQISPRKPTLLGAFDSVGEYPCLVREVLEHTQGQG